MPSPEQKQRMKTLAEYFRNGGNDPEVVKGFRENPDRPNGNISAADQMPSQSGQNVPAFGMHDLSAPETQNTAAGTIDSIAEARARQLQQTNLASQQQPEPDLTGYKPWKPMPMDQAAQALRQQANNDDAQVAPAPRQFSNIRDRLQGAQEVTPELEKQLGYGDQDDDDDDSNKNLKGSSRMTGTPGGI